MVSYFIVLNQKLIDKIFNSIYFQFNNLQLIRDVLAVPALYKREYFSGLDKPYPDITFQIKLRRKTLFYTVNLIIPILG